MSDAGAGDKRPGRRRREPFPDIERIAEPFPVPLTIGVVSDTHVGRRGGRALPPQIPALFRRMGVGVIAHAGDVNVPEALASLAEVAPTLTVRGNNDWGFDEGALPDRIDFAVGRFRFALVHGQQLGTANRTARSLVGTVDCVIFGHSHKPGIVLEDGTILFNPGSPTDRRWNPHFGVGLIRVDAERIDPELILFSRPDELDRIEPAG
ncbi:MAG TPA: metallophosphoesterase family protein [Thermomicrobiales bacterium]|nr:metallophosphoesterase family protein [Thermomicrobiales bacterium]